MTVYLDSSALVKLLVREKETTAIRAYVAARPSWASSILASVEVMRAVQRRAPDRLAEMEDALSGMTVIACDRRIALAAGRVPPPSLRSLDAIHLASALELGSDLEAVVTYDDRLADAARALGLPVVAPGANEQASIGP